MPRFRQEPAYTHGTAPGIGVLLVNLGTPEAPTAPALRRYLREFLWDPRVVELPRPLWWLILHGVVLRTRPQQSAHKYASIWTPEGSPLRLHLEKQTRLLRGWLGEAGLGQVRVEHAMRYGAPSIPDMLEALRAAGRERILVLPLYPQYSASTTASVFDQVARCIETWRNVPELRLVRGYHDDPGYIRALAASINAHWVKHGRPDKLVMSFHGVPRFQLERGDPYHCLCHKTGRLLAEQLGIGIEQYVVSFQSRFGRAEWLQPYTQATLEALARSGAACVDVVCPGFSADCLETLEEIAIENRAAFLKAGGREFRYIPCLNEQAPWIDALAALVRRQLAGWIEQPAPAAEVLAQGALRARALGAAR